MFDIKKAEADAKAEIAKEAQEKAKGKIKTHLGKIAAAKQVVANLEHEYEVLLREVGSDVA